MIIRAFFNEYLEAPEPSMIFNTGLTHLRLEGLHLNSLNPFNSRSSQRIDIDQLMFYSINYANMKILLTKKKLKPQYHKILRERQCYVMV